MTNEELQTKVNEVLMEELKDLELKLSEGNPLTTEEQQHLIELKKVLANEEQAKANNKLDIVPIVTTIVSGIFTAYGMTKIMNFERSDTLTSKAFGIASKALR